MRSATLYDVLVRLAPEPMAEPGRAVAVAMVHGPRAGLTEADALADRLAGNHRLEAVRAHLLEQAGDTDKARAAYHSAAAATLSIPEARYLRGRADRLGGQGRSRSMRPARNGDGENRRRTAGNSGKRLQSAANSSTGGDGAGRRTPRSR